MNAGKTNIMIGGTGLQTIGALDVKEMPDP